MNSSSFEQLAVKWGPLLNRFARWSIPGVEREDLRQELLLVLWQAHRRYDPARGASFKTYLFRALLNRALTLLARAGGGSRPRRGVVPPGLIGQLCDGNHGDYCARCARQPANSDDLGLVELLAGATPRAVAVARWHLGEGPAPAGTALEEGIKELSRLLKEGEQT